MSPLTGNASVHRDSEWEGHATVILWSTRGNYKADTRLTAAQVAQLMLDCARVLEELRSLHGDIDPTALLSEPDRG